MIKKMDLIKVNLFKISLLFVCFVSILFISFPSLGKSSPFSIYGKLNFSGQMSDDDIDHTRAHFRSNNSRLGIKGAFEPNINFQPFYLFEYGLVTFGYDDYELKKRNMYLGLAGDDWGRFMIGRNDTFLKMSQGGIDQFNDLVVGDIGGLFKGENRQDRTITYLTPKFYGFQAGTTFVSQKDQDQEKNDDGWSSGIRYGDSKLKQTPVYAAIAYDTQVKGYDIFRASVQTRWQDLTLGGMYQYQELSHSNQDGDDLSDNGYLFSAAYQLKDWKLKAQWQDMQDVGDAWSVGLDYQVFPSFTLYSFYTGRDLENKQDKEGNIRTLDQKFYGLGFIYDFSYSL